jgi:hypothetical protein
MNMSPRFLCFSCPKTRVGSESLYVPVLQVYTGRRASADNLGVNTSILEGVPTMTTMELQR